MTALAERGAEAPAKTPARLLLVPLALLAATAALIVCHGCHAGDHDDELSVPLVQEEIDR